jgi:enoyl-CoA hydratase/3-hydroxyacyl-CoA dehydrogenase
MDPEAIERVAVLGAGTMGHGIATVAALAGYDVALRDVTEELATAGAEAAATSLDRLVESDRIDSDEAAAAQDRIAAVVDVEQAVGDADLAIEAVPERMDIKREVYEEVCAHLPDDALLVTNTSSLSITDLAAATDRPGRFCGMHFFNPPVRMDLVEVIAGSETVPETLDAVEAVANRLGKTAVRVRTDSPGFIVNRVLLPTINEAAWLVDRGVATQETIDATATAALDLPMGPIELADYVGLDVTADVLDYVADQLGEHYAPAPPIADRVAAGDLGRKSGAGFYDYGDGGADYAGEPDERIATLLLAVAANETAKLIGHDVADPDDVDTAMRLGANFPTGPATMATDHGIASLVDALEREHNETGARRYEPARALRAAADAGSFAALAEEAAEAEGAGEADVRTDGGSSAAGGGFEAVAMDRDGGVATIRLDRPDAMNSVTPTMLDELRAALDGLDDAVRAVVLTGTGDRAFAAGADLPSIPRDAHEAVEFARAGQRTVRAFEESPRPVVAAIDGYCLGGGMEVAAGADVRIAGPDAVFGQPEHDLGTLPGWGGTQRLPRLIGEARARELIFTAAHVDAETMRDYGFVSEVADEPTTRAADLAADLAEGPPLAQRYTKRAFLAGRDDMDAGLTAEAEAFGLLAETEDFAAGLDAFRSEDEPDFQGR